MPVADNPIMLGQGYINLRFPPLEGGGNISPLSEQGRKLAVFLKKIKDKCQNIKRRRKVGILGGKINQTNDEILNET